MNDEDLLIFKSLSRDLLGICRSGWERGVLLSTAYGGPWPASFRIGVAVSPYFSWGREESEDS